VTDFPDLPEILRDRSVSEILEMLDSDEVRDLVEVIGEKPALALVLAFGGQSVYVPKLDAALRSARNERIREEFNGANVGDLARRYNLTESRVYGIVYKRGDDDRPEQQRLF
jgi:Mor family transcriptional regulator